VCPSRAKADEAPTLLAPSTGSRGAEPQAPVEAPISRSTVLPRRTSSGGGTPGSAAAVLEHQELPRYEPLTLLGVGGMGEISLVRDNDIDRQVALKRLLPELDNSDAVARFVDEIRVTGQLEHPNIVPIHDVGVDEEGRYYFVMKYVDGETLESIIDRLAAGDPAVHARYGFEQRVGLFLGVLHALELAHAHGIVHRDLKPANVMVGRYGEVVLMDWGIAKSCSSSSDSPEPQGQPTEPNPTDAQPSNSSNSKRLASTQHGALIGTPAYMSPEQASGQNDTLDHRSDIYSACVMFHELLTLQNYFEHHPTVERLLMAILTEEVSFFRLMRNHPSQSALPADLVHFAHKGMQRDPADRWQSVSEMIGELQASLSGRIRVQCHATLTKRIARETAHFVDRYPALAFLSFCLSLVVAALGVWQVISWLL